MASDGGEIGRLIRATQQSLVPAPFPPRRDLDIACAVTVAEQTHTVFHDLFWPHQQQLACFVVRIDGGEAGQLTAHTFKALLRAALRSHPADEALSLALRAFQRLGSAQVDAAAVTLSTTTGDVTLASIGAGQAVQLAPDAKPRQAGASMRLACGDFCWLSVGETAAPRFAGTGSDEAVDLVHATLSEAQGAAAAALRLRSLREERGRTFVLTNDVAQISPLLAEVEEYLFASGPDSEVLAGLLAGLDVAMDEVLTNIVLYAYRDGDTHEIIVEVRLQDEALHVEIRDDGQPFDPTDAVPPDLDADLDERPIGGLGLHLVRAVFDDVTYRRAEGWNVLSLTKAMILPAKKGPLA